MNNKTGVKILESFAHLINDEAHVYVLENILRNDIVQIGFHELKDEINVLVVVSSQSVNKFYYIWMLSLL